MNFPDRNTPSGALINSYLKNSSNFCDEGIHLLFTLNRWEAKNQMEKLLKEGTTLIVDRYSYSGIAFSAAKGLDFDWCKAPEEGLLKPDSVLLLTLSPESMAKRGGFGNERYEIPEFQQNVSKIYNRLKDNNWKVIDADKTVDDLNNELLRIVNEVIDKYEYQAIDNLKF